MAIASPPSFHSKKGLSMSMSSPSLSFLTRSGATNNKPICRCGCRNNPVEHQRRLDVFMVKGLEDFVEPLSLESTAFDQRDQADVLKHLPKLHVSKSVSALPSILKHNQHTNPTNISNINGNGNIHTDTREHSKTPKKILFEHEKPAERSVEEEAESDEDEDSYLFSDDTSVELKQVMKRFLEADASCILAITESIQHQFSVDLIEYQFGRLYANVKRWYQNKKDRVIRLRSSQVNLKQQLRELANRFAEKKKSLSNITQSRRNLRAEMEEKDKMATEAADLTARLEATTHALAKREFSQQRCKRLVRSIREKHVEFIYLTLGWGQSRIHGATVGLKKLIKMGIVISMDRLHPDLDGHSLELIVKLAHLELEVEAARKLATTERNKFVSMNEKSIQELYQMGHDYTNRIGRIKKRLHNEGQWRMNCSMSRLRGESDFRCLSAESGSVQVFGKRSRGMSMSVIESSKRLQQLEDKIHMLRERETSRLCTELGGDSIGPSIKLQSSLEFLFGIRYAEPALERLESKRQKIRDIVAQTKSWTFAEVHPTTAVNAVQTETFGSLLRKRSQVKQKLASAVHNRTQFTALHQPPMSVDRFNATIFSNDAVEGSDPSEVESEMTWLDLSNGPGRPFIPCIDLQSPQFLSAFDDALRETENF
eukprot:GILK01008999.1.p1 GENE.GILK01008999.1~~GILK01008999.1.p1  ORF type:complete len:669 (+),score=183.75 GILK01008999.1:48-2009(+)